MLFSSATSVFRNLQIFHFIKTQTQISVRFKHAILETVENKLGIPLKRPKRPIVTYFRYMIAIRPSVVAKHPKLETKDHVKLISKMWNSLDASAKEEYSKSYSSEQVVYNQLLTKYNETLTEDQKRLLKVKRREIQDEIEKRKYIRSQRKRAQALDKPKKPMSMFLKYLEARADRQPNEIYLDYLRRKSSEWKSLSKSEQDAFREPAECEQKYRNDLLEWKGKVIKLGEYGVLRSEIPKFVKFDDLLKPKKSIRAKT